MRWIELSVNAGKDSLEKLVSVLEKYSQGGAAVEENQDAAGSYTVKIYLPSGRQYNTIRREIENELKPYKVQLNEKILRPADWFDPLKDHFHATEVGQYLLIKPTWIDLPSPEDRVVIELDPGTAFGTGIHPTTRLCLVRLEQHLQRGMDMLDLGCGTGILAIAAAKLAGVASLALDIDPVAVKSTSSNTKANSVDGLIEVRRGTLSLRRQREFKERFDIVAANISAPALSGLIPRIFAVTKKGGIFIGTGIHRSQADEIMILAALAGFEILAVDNEEEWSAVVARKPSRS
jgi:ribosomal protein L11 methyltransferase